MSQILDSIDSGVIKYSEIIEYPDGRVYLGDKLIAEEPNEEQKAWFVHKMKNPARCWNTCISHKPWIFRWNYCVVGEYPNE